MTNETIDVGDRVRLKGDHGDGQGGPARGICWMTVTSRVGDVVAVSYWTTSDAGARFLARLDGVERAALTTQPPGTKIDLARLVLRPADAKAKPTKRRAR